MKRALLPLLLVIVLVFSACSAGASNNPDDVAIDQTLLTAFESPLDEAEKLLGVTFDRRGEIAEAKGKFTFCGRELDTYFPYVSGIPVRYEATGTLSADEAKEYLDTCFERLSKQFGDPTYIHTHPFPEGGSRGEGEGVEYTSGLEKEYISNFWDGDTIGEIIFDFPLTGDDPNVVGNRIASVYFTKDAKEYQNIDVKFIIVDIERSTNAVVSSAN